MGLLALENLHLSFGGVAALAGVSLDVARGEFFAVIGPNGAGKTSIFNCISGIYAPTRGRITFDGRDITWRRDYSAEEGHSPLRRMDELLDGRPVERTSAEHPAKHAVAVPHDHPRGTVYRSR